ncbi:hypothetical protein [Lunatibacter salilacus]|uniref:hypothetical protein n=1 Tax=Lunatibacter salilacus TaxID=2483804 RepID=UPI0018FE244E|nr:hypothetical protein [Lunatibacter salilacus]
MKNLLPIRILTFIVIFLGAFLSYGQKQPGIPRPRGPVDLSETANVVMFIILPALVVIGYFFWRSAMKKRREE